MATIKAMRTSLVSLSLFFTFSAMAQPLPGSTINEQFAAANACGFETIHTACQPGTLCFKEAVEKNVLVPVVSTEFFVIDEKEVSMPYARPHVVDFLVRFGVAFKETYPDAPPPRVTSLFRQAETQRALGRISSAGERSTHRKGAGVDISIYASKKFVLDTNGDQVIDKRTGKPKVTPIRMTRIHENWFLSTFRSLLGKVLVADERSLAHFHVYVDCSWDGTIHLAEADSVEKDPVIKKKSSTVKKKVKKKQTKIKKPLKKKAK